MLPPGCRIIVAVSGGADSVCLLHVLRELAPASLAGIAHFNHKWRAEASDEDEAFAAELAAQSNLPFFRAEAAAVPLPGNLEQNARRARLKFFSSLDATVALGHTRDDQAETVLFRFLRGSGLAGLAGIKPVADGIIRPLLDITRSEIEHFLRSRQIPWRNDATNLDPRFARNRIRRDLLPQLARDWNPQIVDTLAHLADLAHEEETYWQSHLVCQPQPSCQSAPQSAPGTAMRKHADKPADSIELPLTTLTLPRALARRQIRRAISLAKGDLRRIEFHHIESILNLKHQLSIPGLLVTRSFDWIRFGPTPPPADPVEIPNPGVYPSPDGLTQICVEAAQADPCATLKLEEGPISFPLELRGWRPGDRYRPHGQSRDQKIQEMFQKARIPSWRRQNWPIVACLGRVLWARQFGAAEDLQGLVVREVTL
jgi:tRNA(Ile)-lysidine synthase